VTFRNDDGANRQEIITRCRVGERLKLVRWPYHEFDPGAIAVMRQNGEQLGFIPEHVSRAGDSSGLAQRMDSGTAYQCRISDITGGGPSMSYGVNIEITDSEFPVAPVWLSPADPYPGWSPTALWIAFACAIVLAAIFVFAQTR
jgi:hypothetical protein